MTYPSHSHLTDDQIDDYLMEAPEVAPNSEAARHLSGCSQCQAMLTAERTNLAEAIEAFNQASLASAQARSNTIPLQLAAPVRAFGLPAWSLAGVAVIIVGIVIQADTQRLPGWSAPPPISLTQGQQIEVAETTDIAQDNLLLSNIGRAIDAPVASPATLFHAPMPGTERQVNP